MALTYYSIAIFCQSLGGVRWGAEESFLRWVPATFPLTRPLRSFSKLKDKPQVCSSWKGAKGMKAGRIGNSCMKGPLFTLQAITIVNLLGGWNRPKAWGWEVASQLGICWATQSLPPPPKVLCK